MKGTLGACWSGAALLEQAVFRATQARAQAAETSASLFRIQQLAPGVYAAVAKPAAVTNCNAVIFENQHDLLIVDTHSKPSAVVALVSQLRKEVSQKPVGYIVNSHFHWDHTQGNSAYLKTSPAPHVISSETTRKLLSENGAERLRQSVEQMKETLDRTQQERSRSKDPAQAPLLEQRAREIASYIAEMKNYTPELPDLTFERDLVLHDKAHDLHVAFRGRAHTAGDVVLFCPQKKVVATGDMIHSSVPFIGDAFPREWPKTMRSVAEFPFEHLTGGHGPVQHGKAYLQGMAGYIEEVTARVERDQSKPLAELQSSITPATLKSLSGEYGKFVSANLQAANPSVDPSTALANGVRTNIGHILQRLTATA